MVEARAFLLVVCVLGGCRSPDHKSTSPDVLAAILDPARGAPVIAMYHGWPRRHMIENGVPLPRFMLYFAAWEDGLVWDAGGFYRDPEEDLPHTVSVGYAEGGGRAVREAVGLMRSSGLTRDSGFQRVAVDGNSTTIIARDEIGVCRVEWQRPGDYRTAKQAEDLEDFRLRWLSYEKAMEGLRPTNPAEFPLAELREARNRIARAAHQQWVKRPLMP